jgi:CRISPR-associated endonuclease/helicase Cas3
MIFWAKTDLSNNPATNVADHCMNVGAVAGAIFCGLPSSVRSLMPEGYCTLVALHDIGKISPGFQSKCLGWIEQNNLKQRADDEAWGDCETNHALFGQNVIEQRIASSLEARGRSRRDAGEASKWALAIGAHHGRIHGHRSQPRLPRVADDIFAQPRQGLIQNMIELFGALPTVQPSDAQLAFLSGLMTVADWIGSDERFFPNPPPPGWCFDKAKDAAARALREIRWQELALGEEQSFAELFALPPSSQPNELQTDIVKNASTAQHGLYIQTS